MSPPARRGRLVYLVLAAVLIVLELLNVCLHFYNAWSGGAEIAWWKSVALPLTFVGMVVAMGTGDRFSRWSVAVWLWLAGMAPLVASGLMTVRLLEVTPPDGLGFFVQILGLPLGILAAIGLAKIAAGCAVVWLPSLRAYLDSRRAASLIEIA